jgi:hypothetical protein
VAHQSLEQPGAEGIELLHAGHVDGHVSGIRDLLRGSLDQPLDFLGMSDGPRSNRGKFQPLSAGRAAQRWLAAHRSLPLQPRAIINTGPFYQRHRHGATRCVGTEISRLFNYSRISMRRSDRLHRKACRHREPRVSSIEIEDISLPGDWIETDCLLPRVVMARIAVKV